MQTSEAFDNAVKELDKAMQKLGGEAPTDVYDAEGYQIWLRHVTDEILSAWGERD
jgi:hypothetical protein